MQGHLYSKCINIENIIKAINEINAKSEAFIAGPDGIAFKKGFNIEQAVKEVKFRLRRYKRVNSKIADYNQKQTIILNLYDRYAHQAVYRIINPIIESKMSIYSYGCRQGISVKIPVSKIANIIMKAKNTYTIEINFQKCFDSVSLDQALQCLKELGINDTKLICTIKHLMWISKEYNSIGLNQSTILGFLLCNCYLHQLDQFLNNHFILNTYNSDVSNKSRDYKKHKHYWLNWLEDNNKKINCHYYRYIDNIALLTTIKEEQLYIIEQIKNFIHIKMKIDINLIDYKLRLNKIDFSKFHLVKGITNGTWIKIKDEQSIYNKIKKIQIINYYNIIKFKKFLIKILNYYDIVNDMGKLLAKIFQYLFYQCRKGYIMQVKGKENLIYQTSKHEIIDIWKMRRDTKDSFKTYLINSSWIKEREYLNNYALNDNEWYIYKWTLFTKQKGKDKITGNYLQAKDCVIHHIIPKKLGGTDDIDNLILISSETHNKLHYSTNDELQQDPKFKFYAKYRKHLQPLFKKQK